MAFVGTYEEPSDEDEGEVLDLSLRTNQAAGPVMVYVCSGCTRQFHNHQLYMKHAVVCQQSMPTSNAQVAYSVHTIFNDFRTTEKVNYGWYHEQQPDQYYFKPISSATRDECEPQSELFIDNKTFDFNEDYKSPYSSSKAHFLNSNTKNAPYAMENTQNLQLINSQVASRLENEQELLVSRFYTKKAKNVHNFEDSSIYKSSANGSCDLTQNKDRFADVLATPEITDSYVGPGKYNSSRHSLDEPYNLPRGQSTNTVFSSVHRTKGWDENGVSSFVCQACNKRLNTSTDFMQHKNCCNGEMARQSPFVSSAANTNYNTQDNLIIPSTKLDEFQDTLHTTTSTNSHNNCAMHLNRSTGSSSGDSTHTAFPLRMVRLSVHTHMPPLSTGRPTFYCQFCKLDFDSEQEQIKHMSFNHDSDKEVSHRMSFEVHGVPQDNCGTKLQLIKPEPRDPINSVPLQKDIHSHSSADKQHACKTFCKGSTQAGQLQAHMKQDRPAAKPFQCPHCSESFYKLTQRNSHIACHQMETDSSSISDSLFHDMNIGTKSKADIEQGSSCTSQKENIANLVAQVQTKGEACCSQTELDNLSKSSADCSNETDPNTINKCDSEGSLECCVLGDKSNICHCTSFPVREIIALPVQMKANKITVFYEDRLIMEWGIGDNALL